MQASRVRLFYLLAKPGIVYGNAITAIAGFFLASKGHLNLSLLLWMLLGLSLVIGSACVINNFIDRGLDDAMERTSKRGLVTGEISNRAAIIYGSTLGVLGVIILAAFTNPLTLGVALSGVFFYVVVYSYFKRRTVHGTLVGSVAGAVPPVVGYTSVSNNLDAGALILFLILVFWQMPHFYSIAIYRLKDYKSAKIPVLPLIKGIAHTRKEIVGYIIAFTLAVAALSLNGYTGAAYLIMGVFLGLGWLGVGIRGFWVKDQERWARRMFVISLLVITFLSIMISIDSL